MNGSALVSLDESRGSLYRQSDEEGDRRREETGAAAFSSILVADARFDGGPLVLDQTLDYLPDATVRSENQTVTATGPRRLFVSVADASEDEFDAATARDASVVDATHVATFPNSLTYRLDLSEEAVLLEPTSLEFGVRTATVRGHAGKWHARLQLPDRNALIALRTYCTERGISFGVDSLYQTDQSNNSATNLTDRQQKALLTALEMGYYDSPRGATQNDVAAELEISPSAVSLLLRRATAQLISETF